MYLEHSQADLAREVVAARLRQGIWMNRMGFLRGKSRVPTRAAIDPVRRLHVGCGKEVLAGWCNVDIQNLPGVDFVLDVTQEFPFRDIEYIFCEHFIEHLRFDDGIRFIENCWWSLIDGGSLRISTPNLDWVYLTHYAVDSRSSAEGISKTFMLNRAFYGWGHKFLYSRDMLVAVLEAVGFVEPVECEYGVSRHSALRGLERHERYESAPNLPDVLIFEATKRGLEVHGTRARDELLKLGQKQFLDVLEWRIEKR